MLSLFRGTNKRTKTIWWVLIIVTVVTFVGGFVVLFGLGVDRGGSGNASTLGSVNGAAITPTEYQIALNDQKESFRRQFGSEPADRDAKMVEMQAWRTVVTQKLMNELAKKEGVKIHEHEVVLALETQPPPVLMNAPDFQTNGKFDPQKFQQAIRNPSINWAPFEDMVRIQLPTRKVEERLLASLKLSQTELRETFLDRNEKVNATIVNVQPAMDLKPHAPSPGEIDQAFQTYRDRFISGTRVQLEVLRVPFKYSTEDMRAAQMQAQSLAERARKGEDFAQLAKDYSEGPGAQQGGQVNRVVQPAEFGPFGQHLEALPVGGVSDPLPGGGRFVIFKIIRKLPDPVSSTPSLQVAQIVIKAHGSDATVRQQYEDLQKLRGRATHIGLGRAAAEKGLATTRSRPYDLLTPAPDELAGAPEASDWGLMARQGDVSPVFQGVEEMVVAQVAVRHQAGPATKEEIAEPLRQIAEMEQRVNAAKPKVDQIGAALARGQKLEDAAKAAGVPALPFPGMTRANPDPRLGNALELVGAVFAAQPGQVVGPIRTLSGWYYARVDSREVPPDSTFEKTKGQVSSEILQGKQQVFFPGFVGLLRDRAKVKDLRSGAIQ